MATHPWKRRVLVVGLLAGALVAGPVLAHSLPKQPPAQLAPEPAQHVSDQEINQLAAVVAKLQRIKEEYSKEMGQAENKLEARQIRVKVDQEIEQVLREEGLSLQRYKKILAAVQLDPDLHRKLLWRLQAKGVT